MQDSSVYHDTDLCGFDEHKSVILHLLSQLKLGMDLTKVCLLHMYNKYSIVVLQSRHSVNCSFPTCTDSLLGSLSGY